MTTTSQALEKQEQGPGALVAQYKDDFALVLPSHVKPEQWVRVAQGLLRRDKALAKVAQNNPGSFLSAMLRCAHLGLEPGDTFHLVAFGNEIVGITDYTGEIELIYRAGEVASIKAEVVYSNDDFRYVPGEMDRPVHKPDWFAPRGDMVGVYAYAVMKSGAVSRVVVMNKGEVEKVKAVSKTAKQSSSPWNQWPDRMWLKTVVKQLAKWVPSSAEYREQVLRSTSGVEQVSPALQSTLPAPIALDEDDDVIDAELVPEPNKPDAATWIERINAIEHAPTKKMAMDAFRAGFGTPPVIEPGQEEDAEQLIVEFERIAAEQAPPERTAEDLAKLRRGLMAQATKAFPDKNTRDAQRHALAYAVLNGVHKSSNDMTGDELVKVTAWLLDVEEGRVSVELRDGVWFAVMGDNEVEIPAEVTA